MKFCSNCGTSVDDNSRFCSNCGNVFPPQVQDDAAEKTVYIAPQQSQQPQQAPAQAPQQPQYQTPVQTPQQPQYQAPVQTPQQPQYQTPQQAPQQPQYQAPQQPQFQAPVQPPVQTSAKTPKKGMNIGVLIAIIVAAVLLIGGAVLLILDATETIDFIDIISSDDKDDDDKDDKDDKDEDETKDGDKDKEEDKTSDGDKDKDPDADEPVKPSEKETEKKPEPETEKKPEADSPSSGSADFYSEYMDISINVPSGYETVVVEELGYGYLEQFVAQKSNFEGFVFSVYSEDSGLGSASEYVESTLDTAITYYEDNGYDYDYDEYEPKVIGSYCEALDVYVEADGVLQITRLYVFEKDGKLIEFVFTVVSDSEDEDAIIDAMETLTDDIISGIDY